MKIILAVDDSPHSQAALEFVRKAPWAKDARVVVLSAVPVVMNAPLLVDVGGRMVDPEIQQASRRAAQELTSGVERQLDEAGLSTEARVELGDPRDVIVRVAEELNADLIVVGSHGRSGLSKLLMGSVASHVVTHARCSVCVVKRNGPLD